ncbi:low molecular weight phosphotyrosine protein phosphatase [Flavobacteriaceae bacterium F89]|uniref:protein-tyrosine-phosphatase n=1 Tax=Cerina litoralis TaxID=2874477 RepID=A0AAE3EU05_9FLAO|nr:low molecular weight protein-tyrosine-phosphatase [Cerina litoralis]MCG2461090.1 low molecular weight phosphotyrosine protein phosphatase [Cerina litoralis]
MATKILMVCLGNICRSPLAEGILKSKADPKNIQVDSAGTGNYHIGNPPDSRSIAVAYRNGIDISAQRCRQFHPRDFKEFDLIYAMDRKNFENIVQLAEDKQDMAKVRLLMQEVDMGITEVPDPYDGEADDFETVYYLIDTACGAIAKRLQTLN